MLHWWGCVADGCSFSCPQPLLTSSSHLLPPPPTSSSSPTLPQCLAGTGAWQRINTAVKLHSPRYPVFDLQDGQKYQFRVYSVNLYGSSEASAPSEPVEKVDEDGKGPGSVSYIQQSLIGFSSQNHKSFFHINCWTVRRLFLVKVQTERNWKRWKR